MPANSNPSQDNQRKISLLNLVLLFIAVLQGSSQILGLFYSPEDISVPSLLKVWLALGDDFSANWVAVSIVLIFLVLGYRLYSALVFKPSSPGSGWRSVCFLLVNLALCLRVYSSESLFEKIAYLTAHLSTILIVSIIVFFITLIVLVVQREIRNTKELHEHYQNAGNIPGSEGSSEGSDPPPAFGTRYDPETAFRLEHPFSYAYRSFAKDLNDKKRIKREHKEKMLQIKAKAKQRKKKTELRNLQENDSTPVNMGENIIGVFSVILAFAICTVLIISFAQNKNGEILIIIQQIARYCLEITGILDASKGPLLNFLLTSGILFLIVVFILTFFLLIYMTIRVLFYLLIHSDEDTKRIHRIGRAIKTFVLGILDGALRPLLFLPDFLECIEDMLLDTDMDDKINEIYPPGNLPPDSVDISTSKDTQPEHITPSELSDSTKQSESPEPSAELSNPSEQPESATEPSSELPKSTEPFE